MSTDGQRSERRRQGRYEKNLTKGTGGVTRREIQEAEEELKQSSLERDTEPITTFAMMLDDWHSAEHAREGLKIQYDRTVELKRHGRQVDPDVLVKQYAEAKQDLLLIETQFVDFLKELDDEIQARQFLLGRHVVPNRGYLWRVPDDLAERLAEAAGFNLYDEETEEEEEGASAGQEAGQATALEQIETEEPERTPAEA